MTLKETVEKINECGDFVAVAGRKYIYVCRNNGQFHKGDMTHGGGWATFVAKVTPNQVSFDPWPMFEPLIP